MTTLDELYTKVSDAIYRAEGLEDVDPAAAAMAYFRVSVLEEEIAELLGPDDEEGAAARRGVLTAAMRAGQPTRASDFAARYLAEAGIPDHLRRDLEALQEKANAASRTDIPSVQPHARFELRSLVA